MGTTKFDSAENKRLRLVLNARVHRGQPGAAELKKQIDGLTTKEERYQGLRENLVVSESSRPTLEKNEPFRPSRGAQIAAIDIRPLNTMCVVKAFRSSGLALKRNLSVCGHLRESGREADAPVAPLLKVVRVKKAANKGKSKARVMAKAWAKSTGSKGKVKFQGKNQRANKGRNTNKLTGNFTELWFEYMGADVAVKDQVEKDQYFLLTSMAHRSLVICVVRRASLVRY